MTAALHTMKTPTTSAPAGAGWSARPRVSTPLPGPRSAELLARQEKRESNARTYPRHFPFAVAEASGSHIRDLDGNVFIDFLAGAGVLSLGHNHPELVAAATEQMGVFTHGLDMPTPAKDEFTEAQLSMLPASHARPHEDPVLRPDRRQRGRRRDQAVQDRDRPRRTSSPSRAASTAAATPRWR